LLDAGQSTYCAIGVPPGSAGWRVSVPDPRDPSRTLSTVQLRDQSLSTSGRTQRYFEVAGRRYSHILDPRTGWPVADMMQATVIAPAAVDSDALSTAMFVLGPAGARALAHEMMGVAALLVSMGTNGDAVISLDWPEKVNPSGI
ncbi:FAD:protein FMN transferase, partial [Gemmatimonadota bacterium]